MDGRGLSCHEPFLFYNEKQNCLLVLTVMGVEITEGEVCGCQSAGGLCCKSLCKNYILKQNSGSFGLVDFSLNWIVLCQTQCTSRLKYIYLLKSLSLIPEFSCCVQYKATSLHGQTYCKKSISMIEVYSSHKLLYNDVYDLTRCRIEFKAAA